MSRPRPGKARVRTPRQGTKAPTRIGIFEVSGARPGGATETLTLDPSDFGISTGIARVLGAKWEAVGRASALHTANSHRVALVSFLRFCEERGVKSLALVTPSVLRDFERHLRQKSPSTAHQRATSVWVILRGLDVGVLPDESRNLVTHAPNIPKPKTLPTEGLPDGMTSKVIAAARRDIQSARNRPADRLYLTRQELTGFFVALLWELAWSPDVLLTLNFDDPKAPTSVLDWNIAGGEQVKVRWLKNRGGATGTELVGASDIWSVGRILRDLQSLTAPARKVATKNDNTLILGSPWLFQHPASSRQPVRKFPAVGNDLYLMPFGMRTTEAGNSPFRWWLDQHGIEVPDDYGNRISFRAIRPTAKAARVRIGDTEGLHMADIVDDHSIEVYSSRYMRHGALMRELGDTFRTDIAGRAEEFVRNRPSVVATAEEGTASGLTAEQAQAALDGDLEYGLTACVNPEDSPFAQAASGSTACRFAFRSCFHCSNAIVTPRHVARMKAIRDIAEEERLDTSPVEWEAKWGAPLEFIESAITRLEPFASEDDEDPALLIDLGMLEKPEW